MNKAMMLQFKKGSQEDVEKLRTLIAEIQGQVDGFKSLQYEYD